MHPRNWRTAGEGPEYEAAWALGADTGVGDLDAVIKANWLCNDLGLDPISMGATLAAAMELYERGVVTDNQVELPLKFGSGDALVRMVEETETAIRELHDPARRVVTIGANEAAVHALLPVIAAFRNRRQDVEIDVRRTQARHIAEEVLAGALDFGVITSQRIAAGLRSIVIAADDLEVLLHPGHPLASLKRITMEQFHRETIIAHNDPSPARDYVLRSFADRGLPLSTMISLPSLDAIKTAVEMRLGVALLPRRCALAEIAKGALVALPLTHVSRSGSLRLAFRRERDLSPEAAEFVETAREIAKKVSAPSKSSSRRQRGSGQAFRPIPLAS
jgi:DNA-binding transcriptional LysR family regulator